MNAHDSLGAFRPDATMTSTTGKVWTEEGCSHCGGHGLVSLYVGNDFDGATECRACGGTGSVWRSPGGARAMYPGGPFCG